MSSPVSTTSSSLKARISEALGKLQVPRRYESVWIGPFEQLAGAGHSLLMSEDLGFSGRQHPRTYFIDVQCKIVSLLKEAENGTAVSNPDAYRYWLSRYYFNSGIQRVDYAAERMISTFGDVHCICGKDSDVKTNRRWPSFRDRTKGANVRLLHARADHRCSLSRFEEIISQLDPDKLYERNDPFDESRGLAMIRNHVNSRKHSVYRRATTLDSLPAAGVGQSKTWSNAGNRAQMEIAVDCFILACDAYAELLAWHPNAHD